jgi:hypothetical protein
MKTLANLTFVVGCLFSVAACQNASQVALGTTTVSDVLACAIAVAPAVQSIAAGTGTASSKGVAAGVATASNPACAKLPSDVSAQVAASVAATPAPTAPATTQ